MNSPEGRIIQSQVPDEYDGWRLDKYLAARFTYFSRNRWTLEIQRGCITRNGRIAVKTDERVHFDDCISFNPGDQQEPEVDLNYTVLYEDEYLIAINKTGNLPVHPSGKFFQHTLLYHMEAAGNCKFYPVHRLDRETSGVILFGKNSRTASKLQNCLKTAVKTYIAVVRGTPLDKIFTTAAPLGNELDAPVSKKQGTRSLSVKSASTAFQVLYTNNTYSLIKALPRTGRYHQIRAHLEHAGFPIVGDKLYGGNQTCYLEFVKTGFSESLSNKLGFQRTALHARSLKFHHPHLNKFMVVKAPLSPDLQGLLTQLFS